MKCKYICAETTEVTFRLRGRPGGLFPCVDSLLLKLCVENVNVVWALPTVDHSLSFNGTHWARATCQLVAV